MGAFESLSALTPATCCRRDVLADLDPANDAVVAPPAPIQDCEEKLRAAGVDFVRAELPVTAGNAKLPICGVEQAVVYRRGPAKLRYSSSPIVSCGMALGLARFEQVLSQEAERHLGQSVVRVELAARTTVERCPASTGGEAYAPLSTFAVR